MVLWTSPDGYDAYNTNLHFEHPPVGVKTPPPGKLRYAPGRKDRRTGEVLVPPGGSLLELEDALELFVVHYDAGATSQSCFRTLHDRRALSVHFMIDLDGTIYQTLDLRDTAWHARQANNRSVGVEIAQIGAYALDDTTLDEWYESDVIGTRINLPRPASELGVRTPRFVARPARPGRIRGRIHGKAYQQYDFTAEQYDSLVKLTAALCRLPEDRAGRAPRLAGVGAHDAHPRGGGVGLQRDRRALPRRQPQGRPGPGLRLGVLPDPRSDAADAALRAALRVSSGPGAPGSRARRGCA